MSCRPHVIRDHRWTATYRAKDAQQRRRLQRLARRGVRRLTAPQRVDLQRRLDGLPKLCEDCRQRPWQLRINLPGNWLPTRVCHQCYYGDEDGDGARGWEEAGWLPICTSCGGSGQFDDAVPCSTCDGNGTVGAC